MVTPVEVPASGHYVVCAAGTVPASCLTGDGVDRFVLLHVVCYPADGGADVELPLMFPLAAVSGLVESLTDAAGFWDAP